MTKPERAQTPPSKGIQSLDTGIAVALALLGPSSQVNLDAQGPHIQALLKVARELSSQLGYQADMQGG